MATKKTSKVDLTNTAILVYREKKWSGKRNVTDMDKVTVNADKDLLSMTKKVVICGEFNDVSSPATR